MSFAARIQKTVQDIATADAAREENQTAPIQSSNDNPHSFLLDVEARRAEVDRRQAILGDWLRREGYEAVFLFDPNSLSWLTAGGDLMSAGWQVRRDAFLFVTEKQRCLVSSNELTARLFNEELDGLGFQSKQFSWNRTSDEIIAELRGGRTIPADFPGRGLLDRSQSLAKLRSRLAPFDRQRYHALASYVSHAVEATCRAIRPGEHEWEVAAHLSHRLMHHGIEPIEIHVHGSSNHCRPGTRKAPIGDACGILTVARCRGLSVSTARSISFGPPSATFREAHRVATLVCGTLMRFTVAGESIGSVVQKGMRIYQKYGAEFAWIDAAQGRFAGYSVGERPLIADATEVLEEGEAIAWSPICQGIPSADTVVVGKNSPLPMIHYEDWPTVGVEIHGSVIPRPDILIREV